MSTTNASLREVRLVVGRLLYVAGLPKGCVYPVRDVIVDAQALGLDALGALERTFDDLPGNLGRLSYTVEDGRTLVDANGQPSYLVAPGILDLLVTRAAEADTVVLEVRNARDPFLLAALTATGYLHQLAITVVAGATAAASTAARARGGAWLGELPADSALVIASRSRDKVADVSSPRALGDCVRRALSDGFDIDTALWWRMFELSNDALTPDSDLSRRHAGASLLDHGGKIIGEIGEDDDYKQAAGMPTDLAV